MADFFERDAREINRTLRLCKELRTLLTLIEEKPTAALFAAAVLDEGWDVGDQAAYMRRLAEMFSAQVDYLGLACFLEKKEREEKKSPSSPEA